MFSENDELASSLILTNKKRNQYANFMLIFQLFLTFNGSSRNQNNYFSLDNGVMRHDDVETSRFLKFVFNKKLRRRNQIIKRYNVREFKYTKNKENKSPRQTLKVLLIFSFVLK